MSALPDYVEYGPRATFPPAFLGTGGKFLLLVLEGELTQIECLCERVLNKPAQGKVTYTPFLGPFVVLMAGSFERLSSQAAQFVGRGYASETGLVLWLPLLATDDSGEMRVCLAAPYVFVDNQMSLLCGREDFGYAKAIAKFHPKTGSGPTVKVEAFGGNFGPGNKAGWCELLSLVSAGGPAAFSAWTTPLDLATDLVGAIEEVDPQIQRAVEAVEEIFAGAARQVFLKQFRDAQIAGKACYRYVVEAPVEFAEPAARLLLQTWDVVVTPLDSHPITADLGVATQTALLALELEMNLILNPGAVVAP
jgi:hypothetical protein